jgi:hypothetical protein
VATVLNVFLDLLLAGSLLLFGYGLIQMVIREQNRKEQLLLSMALVAGAVVALGAQASGVGFATYTVDALTGARPGGAFVKTISVLVPGGLAAGLGWYFLRIMQRSAAKGLRLMSFLGMLTVVGFAEIYAQATNTKGVVLGAAAIPNASFVAGLILSLLVLAPEDNARESQGAGRLTSIADALRKRSRVASNGRTSSKLWTAAGLIDGGPIHPAAETPVHRNLFAED